MKEGVGMANHHEEGDAKKLSISSIQAYVPLETKERAQDEKNRVTQKEKLRPRVGGVRIAKNVAVYRIEDNTFH